MPSFGDTALIALIALLLFGPKKLPELARQLGKLMGEFRRASNEFRMQMEDELRISEQEEQKKKIAAIEAAAPVAPALVAGAPELQDESIVIDHPHQPAVTSADAYAANTLAHTIATPTDAIADAARPDRTIEHTAAEQPAAPTTPIPIASAGGLHMMPPATGLPMSRNGSSALSPVLDSIPHAPVPEAAIPAPPAAQPEAQEASLHG